MHLRPIRAGNRSGTRPGLRPGRAPTTNHVRRGTQPMDSSRTRNSTRAIKARSVQKASKPRLKPTDLRNPAGSLPMGRDERKARAEVMFQRAKAFPPARQAKLAPSATLRDVCQRLEAVRSIAHTSSAALKFQRADIDVDVAVVIQRCIADEIDRLLERIDSLLSGVK